METDPVLAFGALAHPQRLAVFRLLMRVHPDQRSAGAIGLTLDLRPSTLSAYLAQLHGCGLITQERRGTSLLYAAAPGAAAGLSAAWLGAICHGRAYPDLGHPAAPVLNVLFVGRGNRGPSLLAEAALRARAGERFEVFSAGIEALQAPAPPEVLAFANAVGHDGEALYSKPVSLMQGPEAPRFFAVIALGDGAGQADLAWPGCPHYTRWRLAPGRDLAALDADLAARIAGFVALDLARAGPAQVQAALDRVAVAA